MASAIPTADTDVAELVRAADMALYETKAAGRNYVRPAEGD